MNAEQYYSTVAILFPSLVDRLIDRLKIPNNLVKYVDLKFSKVQESGVFFFENEQIKKTAIDSGSPANYSEFTAQILNNEKGKIIFIKVHPLHAPAWNNVSDIQKDIIAIFKDITTGGEFGRYGYAYYAELYMKRINS
jgi:hypothetical protein